METKDWRTEANRWRIPLSKGTYPWLRGWRIASNRLQASAGAQQVVDSRESRSPKRRDAQAPQKRKRRSTRRESVGLSSEELAVPVGHTDAAGSRSGFSAAPGFFIEDFARGR